MTTNVTLGSSLVEYSVLCSAYGAHSFIPQWIAYLTQAGNLRTDAIGRQRNTNHSLQSRELNCVQFSLLGIRILAHFSCNLTAQWLNIHRIEIAHWIKNKCILLPTPTHRRHKHTGRHTLNHCINHQQSVIYKNGQKIKILKIEILLIFY